ncbi:MAG: RNA polymerase sigma factor RpoD/SigA [Candidatus Latescibacteria bacterium]|nr:RNA polymerase sigma factor RpoD/SigA [Candidatus Latescibacterota bacterium]
MHDIYNDEESTLRLYFDDIAGSKPLSREREVELATRIHQGDLQARDELVHANLRFVVDVAKKYQNRGLSLSDRISAGNLGLLTAAERFDGTKGFKFISYAVWWIRQSILQTIAEHVRTVRLPLNKLGLLSDISRVSRRLAQGRESEPDVEEIAAELQVSAEEIRDTLLSARTVRSLDETVSEDDERSLLNTLVDTHQVSPDTDLLRDAAREQLERVLSGLDDRELRIIRLYYGLDGNEALNLEQIGGLFKLTRERVRQLKERALNKLRHPTRAAALLALVGEVEDQGGQ